MLHPPPPNPLLSKCWKFFTVLSLQVLRYFIHRILTSLSYSLHRRKMVSIMLQLSWAFLWTIPTIVSAGSQPNMPYVCNPTTVFFFFFFCTRSWGAGVVWITSKQEASLSFIPWLLFNAAYLYYAKFDVNCRTVPLQNTALGGMTTTRDSPATTS